jgi:hypothetical protein
LFSRPTLFCAVPKHKVSSATSIVPKSAQLSPPLSNVNTSIVVVKLVMLVSTWSTSRVRCLSPSLVLMVVDVVILVTVMVLLLVVVVVEVSAELDLLVSTVVAAAVVE